MGLLVASRQNDVCLLVRTIERGVQTHSLKWRQCGGGNRGTVSYHRKTRSGDYTFQGDHARLLRFLRRSIKLKFSDRVVNLPTADDGGCAVDCRYFRQPSIVRHFVFYLSYINFIFVH